MALDGGANGRRPFLIGSDWWRIQNFFAIFTYLCLFMAFIKTKISLDVVEVIATEWKLLLSYYHPIFPSFDAIQFLFILPHLCLLISNPLTLFSLLDPLTSLHSTYIDKKVITGFCSNDIYKKESLSKPSQTHFLPLPPAIMRPKVEMWLFQYLCTPMGFPMTFFYFLLTLFGGWSIETLISN